MAMIDHLEVIYCEGWDPTARAIVRPLPPDVARARDRSGDEYAVLLISGNKPRVLIEIAWRYHTCTVWGFDDLLRRTVKRDLRRLADDHLVLVEEITWEYSSAEQREFDTAAASRISQTLTNSPSGGMMVITEQARTIMEAPMDHLRIDTPAFGRWATLLFMRSGSASAEAVSNMVDDSISSLLAALPGDGGYWKPKPLLPDSPAAIRLMERWPPPSGITTVPFIRPVWQPPQPLQPDPRVLTPAASPRPILMGGQRLVIESYTVGSLHLRTGHVVACDPDDYFLANRSPYTVSVPRETTASFSTLRAHRRLSV
ncbi:hypothetical protein SHL15_0874 [Streptomyces hygroscopicus subsp. limoneus]|nr:hypothetical protein SHL15_0874 [Streptomyces hygroscopicus subsp. limoneus]